MVPAVRTADAAELPILGEIERAADLVFRFERAGTLGITLTTFADVPWNRPWYAKLGFVELLEPGPELLELVQAERAAGLDDLGRRMVMYRPPKIGT